MLWERFLALGCSHGPGITGPLTRLTDIYLRRNLQSELTPVHMKDPKNWPRKMQEEPSVSRRRHASRLQPRRRGRLCRAGLFVVTNVLNHEGHEAHKDSIIGLS